jgi:hypothetical protein
MENTTFDYLDGDYSFNYRTPEVPTSSNLSPKAKASPAVERADQPSGEHELSLLRLSGQKRDKQRDKNTVTLCASTMNSGTRFRNMKILGARNVYLDTIPDLDSVPSDFWKEDF